MTDMSGDLHGAIYDRFDRLQDRLTRGLQDVTSRLERIGGEMRASNDNLTRVVADQGRTLARVEATQASNLPRFRDLETTVGHHSDILAAQAGLPGTVADINERVGDLEDAHSRQQGHLSAWRWIAGAAVTCCGGLIADLVIRAVS